MIDNINHTLKKNLNSCNGIADNINDKFGTERGFPYTDADPDWTDKQSRSTSARPAFMMAEDMTLEEAMR